MAFNVSHIELEGIVMEVAVLDTTEVKATPHSQSEWEKKLNREDYERTYHAEALAEAGGAKQPTLIIGKFDKPENVTVAKMELAYQLPDELRTFQENYFKEKGRPAFDGQGIGIFDTYTDRKGIYIVARRTGYNDYASTNLAMDVDLSHFDPYFSEGTTLRDLETLEGRLKSPSKSLMANRAGTAFLIMPSDGDHIIFTKKRKEMAVGSGRIGVLGGSPGWRHAEDFIRQNTFEELPKEISLNKDEIQIQYGAMMRDITNGHYPFFIVVKASITFEEMARRSFGSREAKQEHGILYKVPVDQNTVEAFANPEKAQFDHNSLVGLQMLTR